MLCCSPSPGILLWRLELGAFSFHILPVLSCSHLWITMLRNIVIKPYLFLFVKRLFKKGLFTPPFG